MTDPIVYDKAKWHFEHPTYPRDLTEEGGYLFGGFFLAWAHAAGLVSDEEVAEAAEYFQQLDARRITPGELFRVLDGALTSEMLSDEGNAFAAHCFESDEFDYYLLFEQTLANSLPSPYHVEDSWAAYDRLAPPFDAEYRRWRNTWLAG